MDNFNLSPSADRPLSPEQLIDLFNPDLRLRPIEDLYEEDGRYALIVYGLSGYRRNDYPGSDDIYIGDDPDELLSDLRRSHNNIDDIAMLVHRPPDLIDRHTGDQSRVDVTVELTAVPVPSALASTAPPADNDTMPT